MSPEPPDSADLRLARPPSEGGLAREIGLRGMLAALHGDTAERPTVGRYVLLKLLGRGGMGFVHLAYDPELDRKVAIKFLQATRSDEAAARLLAEARSLARLQHPHVVTIHDVGTVDGHVYFAMAYMPGGDLRRHLAARPALRWTEVVDLYLEAGEGLVAAHAAGVLHRDVKPDNLFVDADGHVAVGDFGLATRVDDAPEQGVTAGTPQYMSPEQRAGAALSPASDQYSFAAALREGARDAPPALARVLQRATAEAAGDRYPDLAALLHALRHVRHQGRRRARTGAALAAAALLMAGTVAVTRDLADPAAVCRQGADIGATLDPQRLEAAFARHPGGPETLAALTPTLRRYGAAWTAAWHEACDATWTRGVASTALLDLTTACLTHRHTQAEALMAALKDADAAQIDAAPRAVAELPELEPCQRPDELVREAPGPEVLPEQRQALADLDTELARLRALVALGLDPELPAQATALAARADTLGFSPTRARAARLVADAQAVFGLEDPKPAARTALIEALRGRADREAFEAALVLAHAAYTIDEDDGAAALWLDTAEALADRLDLGPSWRARADLSRGYAAMYAMDYAAATEAMRRALSRLDDPAPSRMRAAIRAGLGGVLDMSGHPEEAVELQRLAVDELTQVAGPDNELLHTLRANLATGLLATGQLAEARAIYEDLLARAARLPDNRDTIALRLNLAEVEREDGRLDAAEALLRGVLAALGDPPASPRHAATAWYNLASVHEEQGRYADMLAAGRRAATPNGDDPEDAVRAARDTLPVGVALHHLGRSEEAHAALVRAVDTLRAALGSEHPDAWDLLDALARIDLDRGRYAEALAWAAEARRTLPPDDLAALTALREAEAHAGLGDADAARAALPTLAPDHPEAHWRTCLAAGLGLPAPGLAEARAGLAASASVADRGRAGRCGR